jgi:biopolymer transport protein ExbD
MRVPSNRSRGSVGFNMTPMIDMTFLLIIFFLVSGHLARQEVQLDLDLPPATTGRAPEEDDGARRLVVNVLKEPQEDRRIMVGGTLLDQEELARLIRYESGRAGGQLEVRIRGDRAVPYRDVEPIMLACARSGVWKVTFAVVSEK